MMNKGIISVLSIAAVIIMAVSCSSENSPLSETLFESASPDLFFLHSNGVTILCPDAENGDTGVVNGIEYTKRSRAQITAENASTTCTSGITDLSELFAVESTSKEQRHSHSAESSNSHRERVGMEATDMQPGPDITPINKSMNKIGSVNFNEDISHWDVSSVRDMNRMFIRAESFNQPIGNWDVSNVTDMAFMFFDAVSFNQPIGNWNVSNVTNMAGMLGCFDCIDTDNFHSFNQLIGDWDVSNVTDMGIMFQRAETFNQSIGNWDVSNVSRMDFMFNSARAFNQPIGNWNVSNVTDMRTMFQRAETFNQSIENWDVSNVTDMAFMFNRAEAFNHPIGNWDVSNVTIMSTMFQIAEAFNQSIENWDVSNVTNMEWMFFGAISFNQPINQWCVTQITSEPDGFSTGSPLSPQNKPVWGTCSDTAIVDVTNPATGRTWMDRNLGASRAATSSTDAQAYGDLFQWGRAADGHEKRNSGTTSILSSSDQPMHGDFILSPIEPRDWRNPQNDNLWQGVNGTNNPCPSGYRIPTELEWDDERLSWNTLNSEGAINSPLKLTMAGWRGPTTGSIIDAGSFGNYWSSDVNGNLSRDLRFWIDGETIGNERRAAGISVRCIKD